MKTYTIYALIDPRNGLAFYIGQTTNMRTRFNVHMCKGRMGDGQPCHSVIHNILASGYAPELEVRDSITTTHKILALKLEHWQQRMEFKSGNYSLCNQRADSVCRMETDIETYPEKIHALSSASIDEVDEFLKDEMYDATEHVASLLTFQFEKVV